VSHEVARIGRAELTPSIPIPPPLPEDVEANVTVAEEKAESEPSRLRETASESVGEPGQVDVKTADAGTTAAEGEQGSALHRTRAPKKKHEV
jgi:hypothetical protein